MTAVLADELSAAATSLRDSDIESPQLDAQLLMAHALQCSRLDLISHPKRLLTPEQVDLFRTFTAKRAQRYPLAYIIGTKEFYGLTFNVTPAVLIPRPETEILVEECINRTPDTASIADIGTGSGAIAVALAVNKPKCAIRAVDISHDALAVAESNIRRHSVEKRVNIVHGDLLGPLYQAGQEYDAIVSNPPYIPASVIDTLGPEVLCEPAGALDGGIDGLDVIRVLFSQALDLTGLLMVEIGIGQAVDVFRIALDNGWKETSFVRDLAGIERVAVARR